MMTRRVLGLLAGVLALGGCGDDQFPDYHYKMTIYVGDRAFSSVREVKQREVSSMVDSAGRRVERTLRGEAVILDLDGRTYYALLGKPDNADYATLIAGAALAPYIKKEAPKSEAGQAMNEAREDARREADPGYYLDDMAARSRAMTKVAGPRELPRTLPPRQGRLPFQAWPMFVTFDDPNSPKTVRAVSPDSVGVSRITIEITDEDITTGIEPRLGWLPNYANKMLDGNRLHVSNELNNNLSRGAFISEPAQ